MVIGAILNFQGVDTNRLYEVVQGENILEFWYNDEGGI